MKIGVCTNLTEWKNVADNRFDYVEANLSSLCLASDAEFEEWKKAREFCGLPVEAYNGFFPGDFCIYGEMDKDGKIIPNFEYKLFEIREYTEKGLSRAKALGGKIAVLGSSGARRIPETISREDAEAHFVNLLRVCGDVAEKYGMRIAIEPLRYAETNFINTVSEGAEICRRANHPSVGLLVDFFHFYSNGESLEDIKKAGDLIIHTHIARPNADRKYPTESDKEKCREWVGVLDAIGYNERISLECSFGGKLREAIPLTKTVMDMFKSKKY